jgi:transposase
MRFYNAQHPFYCGLDLHARTMYVCIMNHAGAILVHRNMNAGPEPFLQTIAPYREDLGVCVACIFTWYWLADLCARESIPFVLGHALYMKAIHGGKAKHDKIDAQKMALLLRGGMLPQASVYPAEMRATRDLLRRRMSLTRKRAELLAHIQKTNSQDNLPEIGQKLAYKANRTGVAERFPDPAVQQSMAVDLALIGYYDHLRSDIELTMVKAAKQHDAPALYLLQTVPGIGTILSLVLFYEMQDIARFPRVQDFVSSCCLGKGAKASAGKRYGTSGTKSGNAYLQWAFSAAAVLCLCNHPAGHKSLTRLEKKHSKGKALTVLAHKLARAVYDMVKRRTACDMDQFLHGSGSGASEPTASLGHYGVSLTTVLGPGVTSCVCERSGAQRRCPLTLRVCLDACSTPVHTASVVPGSCGLPLPRTWTSLAHSDVQPLVCVGRYEGTEMFRGPRKPYPGSLQSP